MIVALKIDFQCEHQPERGETEWDARQREEELARLLPAMQKALAILDEPLWVDCLRCLQDLDAIVRRAGAVMGGDA